VLTPSEITKHIKTYLPIFTDIFTVKMTVLSAAVSAANVVTVNATAHGKTVGQSVVITAGTVRNPLTAATLIGSTVEFTTKYDHDLVEPSLENDDLTLTLAGFVAPATVWNGVLDIIAVHDRRHFIVALPTRATVAPTVNETQYLKENRSASFRGLQVVATRPSVDQFTIALTDVPALPPGAIDGLTIITSFRISAAADFKRAQAIYAKQTAGKAYLFVIMTDGDVSKDRHTMNDGVAGFTPQDLQMLKVLRNFSTVVFLPTTADMSGADAHDIVYGTLYTALLATLFGYAQNNQVVQYSAVPTGDGPAEYNTAYYAHVYDWQLPTVLTFQDGFAQQFIDVAFRDIEATFQLFADTKAEMELNIDLDEE
jgi:hypothetical protein